MTRIINQMEGVVHFRNPAADDRTLCGRDAAFYEMTLLSPHRRSFDETTKRVNCPGCAKVYCAVKNEPWNTQEPFEDEVLDRGIHDAFEPDTKGENESERGIEEVRAVQD